MTQGLSVLTGCSAGATVKSPLFFITTRMQQLDTWFLGELCSRSIRTRQNQVRSLYKIYCHLLLARTPVYFFTMFLQTPRQI